MQPDYHLMARVQSRATGAFIHETGNMLALYQGYFSFTEIPQVIQKIDAMEKCLRIFVASGRIDHSWRDIGPLDLGTLSPQKKQNISQELSRPRRVKISGKESRQHKGSSTLRLRSKLCK